MSFLRYFRVSAKNRQGLLATVALLCTFYWYHLGLSKFETSISETTLVKKNKIELPQNARKRNQIKELRVRVRPGKFILFECDGGLCGGWADRLEGIMSAYAWSLIARRQLLIRISQPCRIDALLEPNKV